MIFNIIITADIFFSITTLLSLVIGVMSFKMPALQNAASKISVYGILLTLALLLMGQSESLVDVNNIKDMYEYDFYTYISKIFILCCGLAVCVFFANDKKNSGVSEYVLYPFLMTTLFVVFLLVGSTSFYTVAIGMTVLSLNSIFILLLNSRIQSMEINASIIYILLQVCAVFFIIFAVAYIYAITGNHTFKGVTAWYIQNPIQQWTSVISVALLLIGMLGVLGVFPFALVSKSFYDSLTDSTVLFVRIIVVCAVLLTLGRVLYGAFVFSAVLWQNVLLFIGATGILITALGSAFQNSLNKIYAYSSFGHISFMILALGVGNISGMVAMLLYLFGYVMSNVALIGYGSSFCNGTRPVSVMSELRGAGRNAGRHSMAYGLAAIAFSGMPPFVLFLAKMSIIGTVLQWNVILPIFIVMIISSIFQAIWVLRLFHTLYFAQKLEFEQHSDMAFGSVVVFAKKTDKKLRILRRICLMAGIFFLLYAYPIASIIREMANTL